VVVRGGGRKDRPSETRGHVSSDRPNARQVPRPNATRRNHQRRPSSKCVMLKVVEGKGLEGSSITVLGSARRT
jgi:hypothetical protein